MIQSRFSKRQLTRHDWEVKIYLSSEKFGFRRFLIRCLLNFLDPSVRKKLYKIIDNQVQRSTFSSLMTVAETMQSLKRAEGLAKNGESPPICKRFYRDFFCYVPMNEDFLEKMRKVMKYRNSLVFSSKDSRRMNLYTPEFFEYFEKYLKTYKS